MTITYPLALPTKPGVRKVKITMDAAVAVSESPLTFEEQVYVHQGQRWKAVITLPVMRRPQAELWLATMAKLNGRRGTFLTGDPDAKTPRGLGGTGITVRGGGQTGNTILLQGLSPSSNSALLTGDYIQLGSGSTARLYKLLDDLHSDGGGVATGPVLIWPSLRSPTIDNDPVTVNSAVTQWRLDAPFSWDADEVSTYSVSFSASESL